MKKFLSLNKNISNQTFDLSYAKLDKLGSLPINFEKFIKIDSYL